MSVSIATVVLLAPPYRLSVYVPAVEIPVDDENRRRLAGVDELRDRDGEDLTNRDRAASPGEPNRVRDGSGTDLPRRRGDDTPEACRGRADRVGPSDRVGRPTPAEPERSRSSDQPDAQKSRPPGPDESNRSRPGSENGPRRRT